VNAEVVVFVSVRLDHEGGKYLSSRVDYACLPGEGRGMERCSLQKAEEFARHQAMITLKIQVLVKNQQASSVYLPCRLLPL
jgi:hypothetical protein